MLNKTGILFLNIGSPPSYEVADVKKYLHNFLMDKDVINLPWLARYILVHGIIVPQRAKFSATNYKKVWLEGKGSPLTVYSQEFAQEIQKSLGAGFSVKMGMRYAEPSIEKALEEFSEEGISRVLLAPLFPQFAEATSGSALKRCRKIIRQRFPHFQVSEFPAFFKKDYFLDSSAEIVKQTLKQTTPHHYLFSFHGLPESHVQKLGCKIDDNCRQLKCVPNCYRSQSFATAQGIATRLGLTETQWSVSFQSRLGRAEWLKPSTEEIVSRLAQGGVQSLAVLCPSFVADCIETLEEIGMGVSETFTEAGGKEFFLIPCVNTDGTWVQGVSKDLLTFCGCPFTSLSQY